mgnify:CR=1 FL=1
MDLHNRFNFLLFFSLLLPAAFFGFDRRLEKEAKEVLSYECIHIKKNILEEKEPSDKVNQNVRIIFVSEIESPKWERVFLLKYKVSYIRKEGEPNCLLSITLN